MAPRVFAAVDLGASGGRVMAGVVEDGHVRIEEAHRFDNRPRQGHGHLRWDIRQLFDEALTGLGHLARCYPQVESIGIDTWGVDYGLLNRAGELLDDPISHRDPRTTDAIADVHELVAPDELYAITGLQFLPFNTIYQLRAEQEGPHWADAAHVVLLPDLLAYWLTGELATEATNASTTGLIDVRTGTWSTPLCDQLEIRPDLFPPLQLPGTVRGALRPEMCEATGLRPPVVVTTVASHDTASAVAAIPTGNRSFAYVVSGTWSLVGLELDRPITSEAARAANFTNERGVDDHIRFLRNVGGLWLLQECLRTWAEAGWGGSLADLLTEAAAVPEGGPTVEVDDESFIVPDDMPRRIAQAAGDVSLLSAPARTARCVLDSLADAYATTVERAEIIASHTVDVVHLVGGGSRNGLLGKLTADRCRRPVTAGPAEATALGNVLVQARAHGAVPSRLDEMRAVVARGPEVRELSPSPDVGASR